MPGGEGEGEEEGEDVRETFDWRTVDAPEFRAWDSIAAEVRRMESAEGIDPVHARRLARLVREFTHAGAMTESAEGAAEKRTDLLRPLMAAGGTDDETLEGIYFGALAEIMGDYFDRGATIAEAFREKQRIRIYPRCYTTQKQESPS